MNIAVRITKVWICGLLAGYDINMRGVEFIWPHVRSKKSQKVDLKEAKRCFLSNTYILDLSPNR